MTYLCLRVEFLPGVRVASARTGHCRLPSSRGGFARVASAHGAWSFALAACADMRLALTFLLRGAARSLLVFSATKIALVAALAFAFGVTGFLQRYRDRLAAALTLPPLPPRPLLSSPCLNSCRTLPVPPPLPRRCRRHLMSTAMVVKRNHQPSAKFPFEGTGGT